MTNYPLEACALEYLRYEKRCFVVCTERTPMPELCRPDVLGLLPSRTLIEVEVKRTMADFRANGKKRGIKFRMNWPAQFYFMVHPDIADNVLAEIEAGLLDDTYQRAGVLTVSTTEVNSISGLNVVRCLKRAPTNRAAVELGFHQIAKMVRDQSGTMCGLAASNWNLRKQLEQDSQPISPGRPADAEPGAPSATAGEPSNSLWTMAGEHRGEL